MFECGYHVPELAQSKVFTVRVKKLKDQWEDLYNKMFADGQSTVLAVQPIVAGIYTLERIE